MTRDGYHMDYGDDIARYAASCCARETDLPAFAKA